MLFSTITLLDETIFFPDYLSLKKTFERPVLRRPFIIFMEFIKPLRLSNSSGIFIYVFLNITITMVIDEKSQINPFKNNSLTSQPSGTS